MTSPKLNPYQKGLFSEYMDPVRLKAGKDNCPCCERPMRAYAKTLDKRLVLLAYDIVDHLEKQQKEKFKMNDVWALEADPVVAHRKICDANKLHYWDLVRQEKRGGAWKITRKGYEFLTGKIQLPKTVWVFNDRVVLEDDTMVHVGNVDERWQTSRADYVFDYVPQHYNTEPKVGPLPPLETAPKASKRLVAVCNGESVIRIPEDQVQAFIEQNPGAEQMAL